MKRAANVPNNLPNKEPSFRTKPEPAIITVPHKAKTSPKKINGFKVLFRINRSNNIVNIGAVIPNKVALAMLMSFTAP